MAHYRFLVYDVFMESSVFGRNVAVVAFSDQCGGLTGTWELVLKEVSVDAAFGVGGTEISISAVLGRKLDDVERVVRDVIVL